MIEVTVQIEIDHPSENTFAFISNFENNPKWQKGMQTCTFTTSGDFGVGSRYDQKAKFLGKEIISTFEVVEYEPGKRVKATSIKSSFPITFTRTVADHNGKSNVRALIEGEPKGFFKIAKPLMKWMVNSSIQKDYKALKALLEA